MDTESKISSLVYEVTFGAVFRIKSEGKRVVACSKRDRNTRHWLPAREIEDHTRVYDDLRDDEFAIVHVESRDDVIRLRDIFRAGLIGDGDTATIVQAVLAKELGNIMEQAFQDWLQQSGPLLGDSDGKPSILTPEELVARYDLKDLPALKLAYANDAKEGVAQEQMPNVEQTIERFNRFVDKIIPDTDELYWFEHMEPLASRIGYVALRNGRVALVHLAMLS